MCQSLLYKWKFTVQVYKVINIPTNNDTIFRTHCMECGC